MWSQIGPERGPLNYFSFCILWVKIKFFLYKRLTNKYCNSCTDIRWSILYCMDSYHCILHIPGCNLKCKSENLFSVRLFYLMHKLGHRHNLCYTVVKYRCSLLRDVTQINYHIHLNCNTIFQQRVTENNSQKKLMCVRPHSSVRVTTVR